MKKNKSFIVRNIVGETVLVPADETAEEFNGMIELSETAAFIWEHIEKVSSFKELVDLIQEEYDVDRETAAADTAAFVHQLLLHDMIEYTGLFW